MTDKPPAVSLSWWANCQLCSQLKHAPCCLSLWCDVMFTSPGILIRIISFNDKLECRVKKQLGSWNSRNLYTQSKLYEVKAALAASRLKVNYFCRTLQRQSCVPHDYILGGKEWWPAIVCVRSSNALASVWQVHCHINQLTPLLLLMLQLGQLLLRSKVTSSECMSACMCAKCSCNFWMVLAKSPWLCKLFSAPYPHLYHNLNLVVDIFLLMKKTKCFFFL